MAGVCGVINVYKEKDYTSHDVVAIVRKLLQGAKTGHTGTLDPQAEGVLPVCVGKATKIAEYLASERKGYRAVVTLGQTTDTQDFTGRVLSERPVVSDEADIKAAVALFTGVQMQTPPMYSAVKIGGRKLYDMARAGIEVERAPRQITIYEIAVVEFLNAGQFVMDVTCSKGTYIRSLCADIGEKLGCGAHMGPLLRTRSGRFDVSQSHTLDELKRAAANGALDAFILPVERVLSEYPKAVVNGFGEKYLYNGNKVKVRLLEKEYIKDVLASGAGGNVLLYDGKGVLAGIYTLCADADDAFLKPVTMLI